MPNVRKPIVHEIAGGKSAVISLSPMQLGRVKGKGRSKVRKVRRAVEVRSEKLEVGSKTPAELKQGCIVIFADFVGFTGFVAGTPEWQATAGKVIQFYNQGCAAIRKHGGRLENILGDGLLGVWGLDRDCVEDDARKVLECCRELCRVANEISSAWQNIIKPDIPDRGIRIGCDIGPVVIVHSLYGRSIYSDTVNIAARLQHEAPVNHLCCSNPCAPWLNKLAPELQPAPRNELRNRGAIRAWQLDLSVEKHAEPAAVPAAEGALAGKLAQ